MDKRVGGTCGPSAAAAAVTLIGLLVGCAPSAEPPAPVAVAPQTTITIAAGQTLSGIAREYDVPMQELAEANHLSPPYRILAGAALVIPGPGAGPPAVAAPSPVAVPPPPPAPVAVAALPPRAASPPAETVSPPEATPPPPVRSVPSKPAAPTSGPPPSSPTDRAPRIEPGAAAGGTAAASGRPRPSATGGPGPGRRRGGARRRHLPVAGQRSHRRRLRRRAARHPQ